MTAKKRATRRPAKKKAAKRKRKSTQARGSSKQVERGTDVLVLDLTETRAVEAWERQPNETTASFAAFESYLSMPKGERSITALSAKMQKHPRTYYKWSRLNLWKQRAQLFDDAESKLRNVRRLARFLEEEDAEDAALDLAFDKALDAVKGLKGKTLPGGYAAVKSLVDVVKMRRARRGQATEVSEVVNRDADAEKDTVNKALAGDPELRRLVDAALGRIAQGAPADAGEGAAD